jgi:hypothetical protein
MTQEASKPTTTLKFPIQDRDVDDCWTTDECYFATRLSAIKMLNAIATGQIEATEDRRQTVYEFNDLCRELGYPPLDADF